MPVTPTYPGVYIEEIPSGVRTITGVSTSVTAFIGFTPKGPVDKPVHIFNFGDYIRNFGGLSKDSELGYAVQMFFMNGGSEAWVVREASGATRSTVTLSRASDGKKVLILTANSEGNWGNYLKVAVDYATTNPDSTFNLTVTEYIPQGTELVTGRKEVFQNLSMDSKSAQYAPNVINSGSQLISAVRDAAVDTPALSALDQGWSQSDTTGVTYPLAETTRFVSLVVDGNGPFEVPLFPSGSPATSLADLVTKFQAQLNAAAVPVTVSSAGTVLKLTSNTAATAAREQSSVRVFNASKSDAAKLLKLGLLNRGREGGGAAGLRPAATGTLGADISALNLTTLNLTDEVQVDVVDGTTNLGTGSFKLTDAVSSLSALAAKVQEKIRAISSTNPALSQAVVQVNGNNLRVVSGTDTTDSLITFTDLGGGTLASKIGIDGASAYENVQRYSLGTGINRGAQIDAGAGDNGTLPSATDVIGNLDDKKGIYALENVDIFNLLCIPLVADMDETSAMSVISTAQAYCVARRAFYIVDPPRARNSLDQIVDWDTNKLTPDRNSALYFPFVMAPDPLDNFRLNAFPPSGIMAGLYARTDSNRGVWKAPAGTESTLANVQGLAYNLTDPECGSLNKLGINCLRQFPVYGRVAWGARTLEGNDQQSSEWKYIPVRRLALYLEESLFRGTQWVVFEPNDEPLWSQIRLNVGAFMHTLFRQGAFQGSTPRDAYFVKCDKETTTQDDINRGVVNILVGFAPLKPAEFVIIQLQQIAGQIQA
jgi:Bacteriophage tail sheath protein